MLKCQKRLLWESEVTYYFKLLVAFSSFLQWSNTNLIVRKVWYALTLSRQKPRPSQKLYDKDDFECQWEELGLKLAGTELSRA